MHWKIWFPTLTFRQITDWTLYQMYSEIQPRKYLNTKKFLVYSIALWKHKNIKPNKMLIECWYYVSNPWKIYSLSTQRSLAMFKHMISNTQTWSVSENYCRNALIIIFLNNLTERASPKKTRMLDCQILIKSIILKVNFHGNICWSSKTDKLLTCRI